MEIGDWCGYVMDAFCSSEMCNVRSGELVEWSGGFGILDFLFLWVASSRRT